jgi:cytochrome bd-I ubiquinol oxidase subunit X
MWYFAWILGLPLACTFAVLNAMWFEMMDEGDRRRKAAIRVDAKAGNER